MPAAEAATLTTMLGGDAALLDRVIPVLRALTRAQTHVGGVGDASVMKLAVNSVITALNQAVAESLVLVESAGADREVFYGVLEDSAAAAPYVHYKREVFLHPESAPIAASMTVLMKDIALAHEVATASGRSLPLMNLTQATLEDARTHDESDLDCGQIVRAVRRLSTKTRS